MSFCTVSGPKGPTSSFARQSGGSAGSPEAGRGSALGLMILGALALWLGFPNPFFSWPAVSLLALLWPVCLTLLGLQAPSAGAALRRGWLCGLAGHVGALYWLAIPVHNVGGLPWIPACALTLFIPAILSSTNGLFACAAHVLRRRGPLALACMLGLCWYLLEYLAAVLLGFPWLPLTAALAVQPLPVQLADTLGSYALSGFWVTTVLLCTLSLPHIQPEETRFQLRPLLAGLLLLLLLGGYGTWRLNSLPEDASPQGPDSFAMLAIDGNVDQNQKWEPAFQKQNLDLYLQLSRQGLAQGPSAPGSPTGTALPATSAGRAAATQGQAGGQQAHTSQTHNAQRDSGQADHGHATAGQAGTASAAGPRTGRTAGGADSLTAAAADSGPAPAVKPLIIWPETALPFFFGLQPGLSQPVRELAQESRCPLLFGSPGAERVPGQREPALFNRAFLLGPDGNILGYHDKEHLVPFGEYLPSWLDWPILQSLLQNVGIYREGQMVQPLRHENLALGMLICYEGIFPWLAQKRVADGANILVDISNDGWFGRSPAIRQHLCLKVLRALEQNRWMLRSTNSGLSGVLDQRGRATVLGTQYETPTLWARARVVSGHSLFYRLSPFLPWAAALLLLGLSAAGLRQRRTTGSRDSGDTVQNKARRG